MGHFLVVVPSGRDAGEGAAVWRAGLELSHRLKPAACAGTVETAWASAAAFHRLNGSGAAIAVDPATGTWLLAVGTWFHAAGYGSGAESRLLERYLDVGPARLGRELEGFFVVVVGDARTRETIVLTDVVGSCHAFVRSRGSSVAISGSSLLLAGLDDVTLDALGCQEFVSTGIVYEDRTFYREVRKLGPATVFRFADGVPRGQERYWHAGEVAADSLDGDAAVHALSEQLTRAARRVGQAFARPVCDLTGGYDSRATVAAFLAGGVPFSTTVSGPAESADVQTSRRLAEAEGLSHLHLEPSAEMSLDRLTDALALTDGECDLVEYARVLDIHRTLAGRFDISINGSFGELARGYWWELLLPRTGARRPLDAATVARRRFGAQPADASIFDPAARVDLVAHFAEVIRRANAGLEHLPNTFQMDHAYLSMRMQRWQGRIASSTDQLWPCLAPFMFRSVLEVVLATASRLRKRSLLIRRMLVDLRPRLAAQPLEHGYPAIPATWRTLHRFWPLARYYGDKVRERLVHAGGRHSAPPWATPEHLSARLRLWQEPVVQELLQPSKMRMAALVDVSALDAFLRRSREPRFAFNNQWARILSLEYALHALAKARA